MSTNRKSIDYKPAGINWCYRLQYAVCCAEVKSNRKMVISTTKELIRCDKMSQTNECHLSKTSSLIWVPKSEWTPKQLIVWMFSSSMCVLNRNFWLTNGMAASPIHDHSQFQFFPKCNTNMTHCFNHTLMQFKWLRYIHR